MNAEKSKTPWGKIAAGCGCLALLALVGVVTVGYFVWSKSSEFAQEAGLSDMIEAAKQSDDTRGMSKAEKKKKANVERKARKDKDDALEPANIRAYIKKPLSKKDIREHHKFLASWKKNPAYRDWIAQSKKVKALGDKEKGEENDSVANQLKKVGASAKWMSSMQAVTQAFDKHIRKEGGYQKYYARQIRIGGVVAASETITKSHKKLKDPDSDAVAKQMLAERPEIAAQYKKNFKEAKKEMEKAKKAEKAGEEYRGAGAMMAMGSIIQGPGTIALARMPEKSFKTWASLSPKERKRLRESLKPEKDDFSGWFGLFSVNPAGLLLSTTMAEFQALEEGK